MPFLQNYSLARAFNNYTLQRVILNEQDLKLLSKLYKKPEKSRINKSKNIFLI